MSMAIMGSAGLALPFREQTDSAINVENYGASAEGSPRQNLIAFSKAIAATPAGGTLVIPQGQGGTYRIDTSGGLAQALRIARPMTIQLDGNVRATHGRSQINPPYIFAVDASDVRFVGSGMIAGPGIADDANLLDDTRHAGLIRVTGDRFSFVGPSVHDVPKIGIHLWKCRSATISARWLGGIRTYNTGHTGLFGIRATGGGDHRITGNHFERDAQGRRLITGYFAGGLMGGTRNDIISDNVADVHEKLAYLYTSGSKLSDCRVVDAVRTDVVRVIGSDNLIERLVGDRVQGGVSIYNGARNTVANCTFNEVRQSGIFISYLGDYRGGYAGTVVRDNIIRAAATATELQDGICLYVGDGDTRDIVLSGNRVEALGSVPWRNGIRIETVPPFFADQITVRDNIINDAFNGLSIRRLRDGKIGSNIVGKLRGGQELLRITS